MKTLVVYDSSFGNTQKIAEEIAQTLGANLVKVSALKQSDIDGTGLFIIGSPINGWRPLPSVDQFLDSLEKSAVKNVFATTFDTRVKLFIHGDAKDKMAKKLESAGANIIIEPKAFYVKGGKANSLFEGELEKAKEWAMEIKTNLERKVKN